VFDFLRRSWRIATPAGLVLAAIACAAIYFTFVPKYRATAWLKIKPWTGGIVSNLPQDGGWLETQLQLMQSPLVLDPVLAQPQVARLEEVKKRGDGATQWLRETFRIQSAGRSNLYQVSMDVAERNDAVVLIDAILQAYYELQEHEEASRMQRVVELLTQEQERRINKIESMRSGLHQLVKQATGKEPIGPYWKGEVFSTTNPLGDLERQIVEVESDRELVKARLNARQEQVSRAKFEPTESEIQQAIDRHAQTQEWQTFLVSQKTQLAKTEKALKAGKNDPEYKRQAAEIVRHEAAYQEFRTKFAEQLHDDIVRERQNAVGADLAALNSQIDDIQLRLDELNRRYTARRTELQEASGHTLDIEFARADLDREQDVHDLIADRIVKLKTELGLIEPRVEILLYAQAPTKPVEAAPVKKMTMAGVGAFFVPFLLGFFWERTLRRISDPNQLREQSGFEIIGEIATLPVSTGMVRRRSDRVSDDLGLYRESIDSLRTSLVLSHPIEEMRILAICSAVKGEGKTSISSQLAVSLARYCGERVLLIDGDMRDPDIHEIFDVAREPGLSALLAGECTATEAVVTTSSELLDVIPGGRLRRNPHALVTEGKLKPLLQELGQTYRYIVIDTPPILAASESLVMARCADASIMCTMRDVSRIDQFRTACERLDGAGAFAVGAVLSGVPQRQYSYRYGHYYPNHPR
jgi:capsular exopolysaccharide synthesis family protein